MRACCMRCHAPRVGLYVCRPAAARTALHVFAASVEADGFSNRSDRNPTAALSRVGDVMSRLSKALPPENYTTDEPSFYQQLEKRQKVSPSTDRIARLF